MIRFEKAFIQQMLLASKIRNIETCGIGNFIKDGKDYIISDFKWAEYTGRPDPSMDSYDLASGASTTVDPKILFEYQKVKPANVEWHSHSNFGVFWSSTDERCIKKWTGQELLSIVTNLAGDILIRFDKAFLRGIETQNLFKGNLKQLPKEMIFGKKMKEEERAKFICQLKKSTIVSSISYERQSRQSQSWGQEELVVQLPLF
jgi:hypothetical protein